MFAMIRQLAHYVGQLPHVLLTNRSHAWNIPLHEGGTNGAGGNDPPTGNEHSSSEHVLG